MLPAKDRELIEVGLPRETLDAAGIDEGEARIEVNRRLVLELYREGLISLGRACDLSEMSTGDFLGFMDQHRTYLNYGPHELEQDRVVGVKPGS